MRNSKVVAIQIIHSINLEKAKDEIKDAQQEITMLSQCDSPHIVHYYGSYLEGTNLWIIMEYLGRGSALNLMKPGALEECQIATILREVLRGLDYLHSERILHGNVKASNVLLSEHGDVKLANLSVAKKLKDTIYQYTLSPNPPFWLAPEVIMQSSYDIMAEIWSLGITAIELAHGEPPHTDIHPMRATFLIAKHPSPEIKGEHSHAFKKFVACCLNKDPEHWPTAKELLKHCFMEQACKTNLTELIECYGAWRAENDDTLT